MLKQLLQGRSINHPLHPILVHLPVGLWVAALVFDVLSIGLDSSILPGVSYYCILLGLAGALIAVPTGLAEYLDIPSSTLVKRVATTHLFMNVLVMLLFGVNAWLRYQLYYTVPVVVTVPQLLLTILSVGVLGASGYLGGLLVYRYGIGHSPKIRDQLDRHRNRYDDRVA